MIYSFLLIGQSNMAGRGFFGDVETINNNKIKILRNGRWQDMFFPVNPDRPFSGVNLAESFADMLSKEYDIEVGLIPCADGGTSLNQWQPGEVLFDNAVYQTRLAARSSKVVGVLWHQGEADCGEELYPLYEEKFLKIMNALRRELELENVPFLLGGLGDFLKDCPVDPNLVNFPKVNEILKNIAENNFMTGFVNAQGLGSNLDNLHFNATALREFGIRYYNEFKKLNKIYFSNTEPCEDSSRRLMEYL